MDVVERIFNYQMLEERFGGWPGFHDAEVLAVRLDNGQRDDGNVSVELDIHAFDMTSEVDEDGYFVLRLHTLVTFRFDGAVAIELNGFGPQNVLDGPDFEWLGARVPDAGHLQVRLPSNLGLAGGLRCKDATVLAVYPFEPGPCSVYGRRQLRPRLGVEPPAEPGAGA